MKKFKTTYGVGKTKYLVSFHDGEKTNRDGSPFYDIKIFSNKKNFQTFCNELKFAGYIEN